MWPISVLRYLDFRGFDSSIVLILRGGNLMSTENFLESLSQQILVRIILVVGRLGVLHMLNQLLLCQTNQSESGARSGGGTVIGVCFNLRWGFSWKIGIDLDSLITGSPQTRSIKLLGSD